MERGVVKAIVQGKTLVLGEALLLPDGTTVTVTAIPQGEISEQGFYSQLAAEGLISMPQPSPLKAFATVHCANFLANLFRKSSLRSGDNNGELFLDSSRITKFNCRRGQAPTLPL
jgi:hypothetical protein